MKVLYIIITFILLILGVTSYIFDITKSKQKIFGSNMPCTDRDSKKKEALCRLCTSPTCKCIKAPKYHIGSNMRNDCPKYEKKCGTTKAECSFSPFYITEMCPSKEGLKQKCSSQPVKPKPKPPKVDPKPPKVDPKPPKVDPKPPKVDPKHSPTPTPHSTHTRASHFFNEKVKKIISISLAVLCLSHLIISIVQFSNAGVDGVKNGLNPFGKSPPWFLSFIIITLLSVITIWNAINMFISSDQITAVL